jgi:Rhodopirellula transposase DDE domain
MVLKYCDGNAGRGERMLGWRRHTIELGLAEKRTGMVCLGAQEGFCGNKLWEQTHAEAAAALWAIAESPAQQDPSFRGTLAYTRLTARAARAQLQAQGFADEELPSPSTMADVLNRNGYRLRPVVRAVGSNVSPWTARPR